MFGDKHRCTHSCAAALSGRPLQSEFPAENPMREHSGLLTDLYELTMAAGYLQTHFEARATFELFVRHLPPHRNYLVAAGLDQALGFLENVHFSAKEIDYLRQHPVFRNIRGEFF